MSSEILPTTEPEAEPYRLQVNGREHTVASSWLGESLLYVLRERLGHPGTKNACDQGECGSCTVLMDGRVVCACCLLAADAVDADIRTVEGLGRGEGPDAEVDDVQRAFLDAGAVQCGFCTPGLVVAVHDLLDHRPEEVALGVREALSGNLCRCTVYGRVLAAVARVRDERREGRGGGLADGGPGGQQGGVET